MKKEMDIDVKKICSEALKDLQPGEDIDEALIRVSKRIYGKDGSDVFATLDFFLNSPYTGTTKLEEVKKMAKGKSSIKMIHQSKSSSSFTVDGVDKGEVPKEILEKLPELFESGEFKTEKKLLDMDPEKIRCSKCGHSNPTDTTKCIHCHSEIGKKKSFFDKLLGR